MNFRWFGYPQAQEGQDLETVLNKFKAVIEAPTRITDDYVWAMARAEILHTFKMAKLGKLRSPREIRPVDIKNPPPLYEIRWQSITVRHRVKDGEIEDLRLLIRMYHSEPPEAPQHFIGHHIHEKDVSRPEEIRQRQNVEISTAVGYFELGKPQMWGISELTNSRKSIN